MKYVVNKRAEPYDVYVGRPSKWGNPYSHKRSSLAKFKTATRTEAVEKFKNLLACDAELYRAARRSLRGKVLGCWCAPQQCHGDVLAKLANAPRNYYAGIGSRKLPTVAAPALRELASALAAKGFVLRSGGARGCDAAFEQGVPAGQPKQIFCADDHIPASAFTIAAKHHPTWRRLKGYVRRLHARNCMQVLGPDLLSPSAFVLCWTPGALEIGGTSQALRVARAYGVEIFNIADPSQLAEFVEKYLQGFTFRATTAVQLLHQENR